MDLLRNIDTVLFFFADSRENLFIAALTNNPPATMPIQTYGYTWCGQGPSTAGSAQNMFVGCASNLAPFRYVVITSTTSSVLNFCELQVYGKGELAILAYCLFNILTTSLNIDLSRSLAHYVSDCSRFTASMWRRTLIKVRN